jgi:hypothetical protein
MRVVGVDYDKGLQVSGRQEKAVENFEPIFVQVAS